MTDSFPSAPGQPWEMRLRLDVDDHSAQAAVLALPLIPALDVDVHDDLDVDDRRIVSGADEPWLSRGKLLEAALKLGLQELCPEASVHVFLVGRLDTP